MGEGGEWGAREEEGAHMLQSNRVHAGRLATQLREHNKEHC